MRLPRTTDGGKERVGRVLNATYIHLCRVDTKRVRVFSSYLSLGEFVETPAEAKEKRRREKPKRKNKNKHVKYIQMYLNI